MTALREPPATCGSDEAETLCAADYPAEPVEWLWPGRIPIGKVTLLVGDPGTGKSLVALDIAARVSRCGAGPEEAVSAAAWPDEQVGTPEARAARRRLASGSLLTALNSCRPGAVLILSAEDGFRDTIRPRLDAADADLNRVFILPALIDLRHDLAKLRAAIDRTPDCRLIIIDPINAYVGPGDSHFQTVVRRVFQPLARLAAEKNLAILAISHLRKNEGAAIQRAAGSMGFVTSARAVWTVCRDPHTPGRHLLLSLKNNFVADTSGLAYSIESSDAPDAFGCFAPAITWHQDDVTTAAADALAPPKLRGPEAIEHNAAVVWLRDQLAEGPRDAFDVSLMGGTAGFDDRTLLRALHSIGGKSVKRSFYGGWLWVLPGQQVPRPVKEDQSKNLSPSAETCRLRENPHVSDSETCRLRENDCHSRAGGNPVLDAQYSIPAGTDAQRWSAGMTPYFEPEASPLRENSQELEPKRFSFYETIAAAIQQRSSQPTPAEEQIVDPQSQAPTSSSEDAIVQHIPHNFAAGTLNAKRGEREQVPCEEVQPSDVQKRGACRGP